MLNEINDDELENVSGGKRATAITAIQQGNANKIAVDAIQNGQAQDAVTLIAKDVKHTTLGKNTKAPFNTGNTMSV